MAGTNLNNNFALKQRKPLDERTTTRETVEELSAIKYPCPNLRVFVAGGVNAWHEYKLVNGVYTWVSDSNSVISYRDLRDLPSINGKQINEDLSLEDLGIQAKGNYLTGSSLNNYYRKDETLSSEEIGQTFPTKMYVEQELGKKVPLTQGYRLISTEEGDKINEAIDLTNLTDAINTRVQVETGAIELIEDVYENVVLYARDEGENAKQVKISVPKLLSEIKTTTVYPTYRSLVGTQNGSNTQFKYSGTLIQETAELYIGGLLYPLNIGFSFEGVDTILITGAPIPTSEDIMRLKAIYLT